MTFVELNTGDLIEEQNLQGQHVVTKLLPRPASARVHFGEQGEILRFGWEGTMKYPAKLVGQLALDVVAEHLATAYGAEVDEMLSNLVEHQSDGPVQYPASE
jgi:hypothetical protein